MGCLSSKPEPTTHKPAIQQTLRDTQPPTTTIQPISNQQPLQHQPVLSVPRPTVTYGDREKNELKVKNLRDKLETTISTSEQVLQDEARLAVRFHREGKKASARILLRRRQLTHNKITNCQNMLSTVMQMIDSMDMARDNAKFIQSVESGTKAINDIMNGMSLESVHNALDDARQADAYTKEIGAAMEADLDVMDDAEFERAVAEMTDRYAVPEEQPKAETPGVPAEKVPSQPAEKTDQLPSVSIPKPPTGQPLPPVTPEPEKEEADERVAVVM